MKFNTLIEFPMTATFHSWEPETRDDQRTYRGYAPGRDVDCIITVSTTGTVNLLSPEKLQSFGIISQMVDAGGSAVMDETWYSIQRITPVFDATGYVSSYRHHLAVLAPELMGQPINPPGDYPLLDQAGG